MSEDLRPSLRNPARGSIPSGLLGMAVLVMAIELFTGRHELDFTNQDLWDWGMARGASGQVGSSCEILCFGDSQVKLGLYPPILENQLGRRSYNLAVFAGEAPSSFFLLQKALKSGARPSAVLVDFKPVLLGWGPRRVLARWTDLLNPGDAADLAWAARDAGLFFEVMLSKLLPTLKNRDEIRSHVLAALQGHPDSIRPIKLVMRRSRRLNGGAQPMPYLYSYQGPLDLDNKELFPDSWQCEPVNETYIRRFMELAESHGIKIYWLLPPHAPGVQARREYLGLEASHEELIRRIQDRFPNVVVIDGRRSEFPSTAFIDPMHLNARGGYAFSVGVADVLRRSASASTGKDSRWIALPAYRDEPMSIPIEDFEQSQLAIRNRPSGVRR